jgi:hypothetical protein
MCSTNMPDFSFMLCHPCRKNSTVYNIQVDKFWQCFTSKLENSDKVGEFRQCSLSR